MGRYIDADKLKNEIDEWLDSVGSALIGKGLSYYGELIGCIEDTPTSDVVEVVRCGDCKHRFLNHKCLNQNSGYYERERNSNDFCSYGERNDKNDR